MSSLTAFLVLMFILLLDTCLKSVLVLVWPKIVVPRKCLFRVDTTTFSKCEMKSCWYDRTPHKSLVQLWSAGNLSCRNKCNRCNLEGNNVSPACKQHWLTTSWWNGWLVWLELQRQNKQKRLNHFCWSK